MQPSRATETKFFHLDTQWCSCQVSVSPTVPGRSGDSALRIFRTSADYDKADASRSERCPWCSIQPVERSDEHAVAMTRVTIVAARGVEQATRQVRQYYLKLHRRHPRQCHVEDTEGLDPNGTNELVEAAPSNTS